MIATRTTARARKPALPAPSEAQIQRSIIDTLRMRGVMAVHVPNAGKRSVIAGRRLKGEGMRPGFPDLLVFGNSRDEIMVMEVKAAKGSLSDNQRECIAELERRGVPVAVVRSVEEAIAAIHAAGWAVR
jgi:hypothetical protein